MRRASEQQGFTLVELAVVLVIVTLIVAGITFSGAMQRSAQIQSAISDTESYLHAVKAFQDKYRYLPGDMPTAENFWGTAAGGCPNGIGTGTQTCNGDGSGSIGSSTNAAVLSSGGEWFRAWQQLANAGFIKGRYTGISSVGGGVHQATPGLNVPASGVEGAGWTLLYYLQSADTGNLWGETYGHVLMFGSFRALTFTSGTALTPGEALLMDQKIDDGKPGAGSVRAWRTALLPSCTVSDTSTAAHRYASSGDARLCSLIFITGF